MKDIEQENVNGVEAEENKGFKQEEPHKKRKQLYRDMENAKIAGVCSGLSHYFGIDMWIFRLAFICLGIFSIGFWIFVYLVLWFIVPQAKSTQQQYEMRGEPLNIEDIEQRVKNVIHEAETKVRSFADKNADNFKEKSNEISSGAQNIFKIVGKIIGVCFIFVSVCAIATILLMWLVPMPSFFTTEPKFSVFCIREIFAFFGLNSIAFVLCLLCVLLPLVIFFLLGISLLISKMRKTMGIIIFCIFTLWIVVSVFFAIGMAAFVGDKITTNKVSSEKELKFPSSSQTIVVKSNADTEGDGLSFTEIRFFNGKRLYVQQNQLYGTTRLDENIVYTNDSVISVRIFKENCSEKTMLEFQNNIKIEDSILYIPYLFPLHKNYWSSEKIKVQLLVPKGKQIVIEDPFAWRKTIYTDED